MHIWHHNGWSQEGKQAIHKHEQWGQNERNGQLKVNHVPTKPISRRPDLILPN